MRFRFCSMLIFVAFFAGLVACGQQEEQPTPPAQTEQTTSAATRDPSQREMDTYTSLLKAFGINPDDCAFYIYQQVDTILSGSEKVGLLDLIGLKTGDTMPAFFWNESKQILYVLKQDGEGNTTLYTLQRTPHPDLSEQQFSNLWTQVEEMKTIPSDKAVS